MSFYIRKSLRVGPLRFNLSKSGIGVSAGIPGFRMATGPRSNYVHMGRKGLYYRKTLSRPATRPRESSPHPGIPYGSDVALKEVRSARISQLQDSSSAELLSEMNAKARRHKITPIATALSAMILIAFLYSGAELWVYAIVVPAVTLLILAVYFRDQLAKTTVLFYNLEDDAHVAYESLYKSFQELSGCARTWFVEAQAELSEWQTRKPMAGADIIVRRELAKLGYEAPPYVKTNLSPPCIGLGSQRLFFFPDRILAYEGNRVGAISYEDFSIERDTIRLIETRDTPSDAKIVDFTWQYVNKKGGPDRRYRDNPRLPIALYTELQLTSQTGLNRSIIASKSDVGTEFVEALARESE